MTELVDVVVVGAGPAGSVAARTCAQAGLYTVLLEREHAGRSKVCGGAVSVPAFSAVDMNPPEDLAEQICHRLHLRYGGQGSRVRMADPLAYLVSRDRLDAFLAGQAEQAGADLRYGQEVKQLAVNHDGVLALGASVRLRARGAVIADGVHSQLARIVRPPFRRCQMAVCLTAEVPADEATIERVCDDSIVIDYGRTRSGYMWLFPKTGHISVGLGQVRTHPQARRQALSRYLRSEGLPTEVQMRGAMVPLKGVTDRVVGNRLLLAGDAAGFVDAFTGEGIQFAMHSGRLAGETFAEAATIDDFSCEFLQRYRDRCREAFMDELRASVWLTDLLYRWPDVLLKTAVRRQEAVETYLRCVGQRGGYRRFAAWFALNFLRLWER